MDKILEAIKPFKKPLIIVGVFLFVLLGFKIASPIIENLTRNKTPIVSIKAENKKSYPINTTIPKSDFVVTATHEDKGTSILKSSDYSIDKNKPNIIGPGTEIKVSLNKDHKISCIVNVKTVREKVEEFEIGSPYKKDVKAVVYSNGELAFEGKGDVLQFNKREFPWTNLQNRDAEIVSISFSKDLSPKIMDNWFAGMSSLEYIEPLPHSVESAVSTFENCENLKEGVDWSQCSNLLDVSYMYRDCDSILSVPPIPSTVKNAAGLCYNCSSLPQSPNLKDAKSLTDAREMFKNCKRLTETYPAPSIKRYESMYENCINLTEMPEISENAISMERTFAGCISLRKTSRIPKNVMDVSSCFIECGKLEGTLVVDAKPDNYSSFLRSSAKATTLNLTGKSDRLDILANTDDENTNILVNNKEPKKIH